MIFNSLPFLLFIFSFLPVYFLLRGRKRLLWCLVGSYFFYGWWDWRFLGLIILSTLVDYLLGWRINREADKRMRRGLLSLSMLLNLGILGFFKYFNFFVESAGVLLETMGFSGEDYALQIILPVGISFYTFQSMSYTIDIYRGKLVPEKDALKFATYISFFPQLVAGPIVRASDFLPQFGRDIRFSHDRFLSGFTQVLWGFFKKVAVADSLAPFVDLCFAAPEGFGGLHLAIALFLYAFQIYCDFSGYSDIAIGLARIMGFDFPENFRTPYFSRSFSEFWTRWHISLSSWLRDYLYIPLGGNRLGKWKTFRNLMITMLLGGLWHGASWTFVFWGFLHGLYLVLQRLWAPAWNRLNRLARTPAALKSGLEVGAVFFLTCIAWVFFRSPDFRMALEYLSGLFSPEGWYAAAVVHKIIAAKGILLVGLLLSVELSRPVFRWEEKVRQYPLFRLVAFTALLLCISFLGTFDSNAFIYFQF